MGEFLRRRRREETIEQMMNKLTSVLALRAQKSLKETGTKRRREEQ